jgi:hypothetical protein
VNPSSNAGMINAVPERRPFASKRFGAVQNEVCHHRRDPRQGRRTQTFGVSNSSFLLDMALVGGSEMDPAVRPQDQRFRSSSSTWQPGECQQPKLARPNTFRLRIVPKPPHQNQAMPANEGEPAGLAVCILARPGSPALRHNLPDWTWSTTVSSDRALGTTAAYTRLNTQRRPTT